MISNDLINPIKFINDRYITSLYTKLGTYTHMMWEHNYFNQAIGFDYGPSSRYVVANAIKTKVQDETQQ